MDNKDLDENWQNWLQENLERNCDPHELHGTLVKNGFSEDSIRSAMGENYPPDWEKHSDQIDYEGFAKAPLTRTDYNLDALKVNTNKLQIFVMDNFLSKIECEEVINTVTPHLRPSTVTRENEDKAYRTSATSDMVLMTDPLAKDIVDRLDHKIAATLGINLSYSEGIQAQRYLVGQEFKKHTDYFQPGTEEYKKYAGKRGQRTWTFMVYLNDVEQGGATRFFAIDKAFQPLQGRAVVWNSLYPDGRVNRHTLHAGLPVEKGEKIIITKWFRVKGDGPIYYE
jgi:prolyl 4-hydroxylase